MAGAVLSAILLLGTAPLPAVGAVLDSRISASQNDAEESATGSVNLTSTALQLVFDTSNQTVGLRWVNVGIPKGSTITAAYIQFYSTQAQSGPDNITFQGQAADNPGVFTTAAANISSRPRTSAAVAWSPPAWISGEAAANERTPDLAAHGPEGRGPARQDAPGSPAAREVGGRSRWLTRIGIARLARRACCREDANDRVGWAAKAE